MSHISIIYTKIFFSVRIKKRKIIIIFSLHNFIIYTKKFITN